jgi:cell division protein FtsB
MPSARSSTIGAPAARRSAAPPTRRRSARPQGFARIRWDRVGRTGLLIVLAVVAGLYVQQAVEYLSTRSAVNQQRATAETLARQNATLQREQQALNDPNTIKRDARTLGMVQTGERPYVVIGLPNR